MLKLFLFIYSLIFLFIVVDSELNELDEAIIVDVEEGNRYEIDETDMIVDNVPYASSKLPLISATILEVLYIFNIANYFNSIYLSAILAFSLAVRLVGAVQVHIEGEDGYMLEIVVNSLVGLINIVIPLLVLWKL